MTDQPLTLYLTKYIESRYFGARPHIRGRRIPVAQIAYGRRDDGLDISELMDAYSLSEAEVLAALLHYTEHQNEIDSYEQAYVAATIEDWVENGDDSFLFR